MTQCHTHRATTKNWSICRSVSGLFGSQTLTSSFDCSLSSDSPAQEQKKRSLVTKSTVTPSSRFQSILLDSRCTTPCLVNTYDTTAKPSIRDHHYHEFQNQTWGYKDDKESTPAADAETIINLWMAIYGTNQRKRCVNCNTDKAIRI